MRIAGLAVAGLSLLVVGCAESADHLGSVIDASAGSGGSTGAAGFSDTGTGGRTSSGTGGASATDAGIGDARPADAPSDAPTPTGVGGSGGCLITMQAVPPASLDDIQPGPTTRVRVHGTVTGSVTSSPVWDWAVLDQSIPVILTPVTGSAGTTIEFPVVAAGTYQITASIRGEPACRTVMYFSTVPPGFILRATADGLPVQEKRITLATDPQPMIDWPLDSGSPFPFLPQRADTGGPLAAYLRITDPQSQSSIDGNTGYAIYLVATTIYDLLVIPSEPYAPVLTSGKPGVLAALHVDRGVHVTARAFAGNTPLAGAKLVLHNGSLPSTLATSDANGAMDLWARSGTHVAYLVPPASSGLPRAAVGTGTDPGIVLAAGASSLDLQMTWNAVTQAALTLNVRAPDGTSPVALARVQVTAAAAAPASVGTLVVGIASGAPVSLPARGAADGEVLTSATGAAVFPSLPVGAYNVTIFPPDSSSSLSSSRPAITTTTVTLASGGLTRNVTLTTKVALNGKLNPVPLTLDTLITAAVDPSAASPGTVATALVAADGSYQLLVDPGRSYQLLAEPAFGVALGRALLTKVIPLSGTTTLPAQTLPVVHSVHGTVSVTPDRVWMPGALIQAFCSTASAKCDPTFPLAEAITASDGSFDLLLPDPTN
jgi:hypothetical protein